MVFVVLDRSWRILFIVALPMSFGFGSFRAQASPAALIQLHRPARQCRGTLVPRRRAGPMRPMRQRRALPVRRLGVVMTGATVPEPERRVEVKCKQR